MLSSRTAAGRSSSADGQFWLIGRVFPAPIAPKVPEVILLFWVVKILTTAGGEATSDYLKTYGNFGGGGAEIAVIVVGAILQFSVRRYTAFAYWSFAFAIAITGTGVSDFLHLDVHIPYAGTTLLWAVVLAVIFRLWYRSEGTLSIHSITTQRREVFYWATVFATFALGTALGDFTATSLNLGYLDSGILFTVIIFLPAVAHWRFGLNGIAAFWLSYIVTRPLGASFADYISKPKNITGLNFGDGPTAIVFAVAVLVLVSYLAIVRPDIQRPAGTPSRATSRDWAGVSPDAAAGARAAEFRPPRWASGPPPGALVAAAPRSARSGCEARRTPSEPTRRGRRDRGAAAVAYAPGSRIQRAGVDDWRGRLITAEHDHQVAHHRCFALLVELDDALLVQARERHVDHANRTLDDLRARRHDGVCLLPAQHRLRDLRGIGEMADPHLDDLDSGDRDALGHLLRQLARDDVSRAAQRRGLPPGIVVGVRRRHVPERRFGLNPDEVVVAVHRKDGLCGIGDLPDDDRRELHRVSVGVVDLEVVGLEVAYANAQIPSVRKRNDAPQARPPKRAHIAAEEPHDLRVARLDDHQRTENEHPDDDRHCNQARRGTLREQVTATGADQDDEHPQPTVHCPGGTLVNVDAGAAVPDRRGLRVLLRIDESGHGSSPSTSSSENDL
jgi:uncharacterized membrane-anchored protein